MMEPHRYCRECRTVSVWVPGDGIHRCGNCGHTEIRYDLRKRVWAGV